MTQSICFLGCFSSCSRFFFVVVVFVFVFYCGGRSDLLLFSYCTPDVCVF